MLWRFKQLHGSRLFALDGEIGRVRDLYFDNTTRVVRYLVVDSGGWLSGHRYMVSPQAIELMDQVLRTVSVGLTRERIGSSPSIDTAPIETHPRSARGISGCAIVAIDDVVGRVEDFLFDDETWSLRYFVVRTRKRLFGRRILVKRESVRCVDWAGRKLRISQLREQIEHGREFDVDHLPPGDFESALCEASDKYRNQA